jgi:hypothetical protein
VSPPQDFVPQQVDDDHPIVQNALDTVQQHADTTVPNAVAMARNIAAPRGKKATETASYASNADLGRLLDSTRGTQVGRMVDRYQKPTVGTAVNRLHGDLKSLATEGEPGRMWYEKSSKRLLDYVQGDKDEAHKLAQLIAIYSPQTTVDINTANAIKAYNRAKSGQKLWDGEILDRDKSFDTIKGATDYAKSLGKGVTKVPLDSSNKRFLFARHNMAGYENIATADRDLKAHLLMNEGIPFEGRKTNNFYRNLMVHIDPTIDQGSTQDLWMARAFGFHDDAVSNATKYDFMEKLTHKLGNELGWKPHQVQAAIWTAMKTRQEAVKNDVMKEAVAKGLGDMVPGDKGAPKFVLKPGKEDAYSSLMRDRSLEKVLDPDHIKRSAKDFSDFLDANLAHVSWEATPSKKIAHLQGLEQLPPEAKADYHKRISDALVDEKGNDVIAKHLGLLSPGTVEAPGYWEGNVNPASHLQVAATRIKAAGQRPDIDAASKDLMETYALARGLLLKQDGVGYHRPYYNPKIQAANGVEYKLNKGLTADQIKQLGAQVDKMGAAALIPSGPDVLRIIHFGGLADHRPFHKAADEALQSLGSGGITAHKRVFASDGDLVGNDWQEHPHGEDYRQRLSAKGRSDVLGLVSNVLAPRVEAVDKAFAREHGLKTDPDLEQAIRGHFGEEVDRQLREAGGRVFDYDRVPKVVDVTGRYASGGAVELSKKSEGPNHDPTEAQKSAGNYTKERVSFQGLPISIENKAGSTRSGVDGKGKRWSSRVPCDYGYIRGTEGADGDHVDCYLGGHPDSNLVVVVNQHRPDGDFDEHKCLLGFKSERDAIRCYCDGFSDGKGADRIGSIESMSVDAFKRWLKSGKTKRPARARSIVDQALKLVSAGS